VIGAQRILSVDIQVPKLGLVLTLVQLMAEPIVPDSSLSHVYQVQRCVYPINGGWSDWELKEYFSVDIQVPKLGHCTNPSPANGGAYCSGSSSQSYNQCSVLCTTAYRYSVR